MPLHSLSTSTGAIAVHAVQSLASYRSPTSLGYSTRQTDPTNRLDYRPLASFRHHRSSSSRDNDDVSLWPRQEAPRFPKIFLRPNQRRSTTIGFIASENLIVGSGSPVENLSWEIRLVLQKAPFWTGRHIHPGHISTVCTSNRQDGWHITRAQTSRHADFERITCSLSV